MDAVVERALGDARILSDEGYDGVIVENYADTPFFAGRVPSETVAAMARATAEVVGATTLPVGVNVLRNDARAALAVATATGARFIRVNVHTGSMWTDQGLMEGRAAETLRARQALTADVGVLADVHVKHAVSPAGETIGAAAADAWHRGRADALVVSGTGTGRPTATSDVEAVRAAVPEATVLVGSGAEPETIRSLLDAADGVIVGSAIMRDGTAGTGVDRDRAAALRAAARG
jgi:membrane complex biogenesis BtpA family protein